MRKNLERLQCWGRGELLSHESEGGDRLAGVESICASRVGALARLAIRPVVGARALQKKQKKKRTPASQLTNVLEKLLTAQSLFSPGAC